MNAATERGRLLAGPVLRQRAECLSPILGSRIWIRQLLVERQLRVIEWRAGVRIELDALSKAFAAESSRWLLRRESGNPSTLSSKNALAPLGSQDQPR